MTINEDGNCTDNTSLFYTSISNILIPEVYLIIDRKERDVCDNGMFSLALVLSTASYHDQEATVSLKHMLELV